MDKSANYIATSFCAHAIYLRILPTVLLAGYLIVSECSGTDNPQTRYQGHGHSKEGESSEQSKSVQASSECVQQFCSQYKLALPEWYKCQQWWEHTQVVVPGLGQQPSKVQ